VIQAADLLSDDDARIARHLQEWEPDIAAMVAASQDDQDAAARLLPVLDDLARDPDWAALAGVLRRILGGERGDSLLDGLDTVDTAIAREALARLSTPEGLSLAGTPCDRRPRRDRRSSE
jgi:hypothetical protein